MKKPINIYILGALIVVLGAILKIQKLEYSRIILVAGLIIELLAVIVYFRNRNNKNKA